MSCAPGRFSAVGAACVSCPEGQAMPAHGATACKMCPIGLWNAVLGAKRCTLTLDLRQITASLAVRRIALPAPSATDMIMLEAALAGVLGLPPPPPAPLASHQQADWVRACDGGGMQGLLLCRRHKVAAPRTPHGGVRIVSLFGASRTIVAGAHIYVQPSSQERVLAMLKSMTIRTSLSQSFLLAQVEYGLLPKHYAAGVGKTGAITEVLASQNVKQAKLVRDNAVERDSISRSMRKAYLTFAFIGAVIVVVAILLVWRRQRTEGKHFAKDDGGTDTGSCSERQLVLGAHGGYDAHRAAVLARATAPRSAREIASPWEESACAVYDPGALVTALYTTSEAQGTETCHHSSRKRAPILCEPSTSDVTGNNEDETC